MMSYKGYTAKVSLDEEQRILHGEVQGLLDVITFEGRSVEELVQAFHDSVDDYLAFCEERGESPEKPYSGRFVVRMDPGLHRKCALAAQQAGMSLNAWVVSAVERAIEDQTGADGSRTLPPVGA